MSDRVRCTHCGGVYDLGSVKTVARYADATVFIAPCCGQQVDDRSWKTFPSFERLSYDEPDEIVLSDGTIVGRK